MKIFSETTYESADVSTLTSSDVLKYALARVPLLDQSTSDIVQTATTWPAFGTIGEDRTPRVEMEKANDLHRYLLRITPKGRKALESYLNHMEALIAATRIGD